MQLQTGTFPVVLGIALDEGGRRRLAAQLDGIGVLVFAPDLATAHAMLGRPAAAAAPAEPVVRVGELAVDRVRCRASWRGVPLGLARRERDLLACLAGEPARAWTYRQLHAAAWEGGYLDPGPVHAAISAKSSTTVLRATIAVSRVCGT